MNKRVAVVTGSANGLGVQTVLALAQQGCHIVINYRTSQEAALALKQQVEQYQVDCLLVQGDVSKKEDCKQMVHTVLEHFKRIDILINNAGPYIFERKKMVDYTDQEWEEIIKGNLSSVFYLAKEVIPIMREQQWGRLINFGFYQANQAAGWMYRSAFAAAKVGLVSLTKTLAEEEGEHGITVNMVCPGDIIGANKERTIAQVRENSNGVPPAPIGRAGAGEDIARVISFLCAEDSDFITGSVIEVSGGFDVLHKREGTVN